MNTTKPWTKHQGIVEAYIEKHGYDNFLREPTIKGTMFVGATSVTEEEYYQLVKNINWDSCWKDAIIDNGTGNPERFPLYPVSSGNYIHCAYHLSQFEEYHKVAVKDLDFIMEIGCGYGAMAKVCYQAGFRGQYILFDLPVFSEIQREYLKEIPFCNYISDIKELLKVKIPVEKTMFISTWAVSEMPTGYRNNLLNLTPVFKNILLAYQCEFEKMDINSYFNEWVKGMENHTWVNIDTVDPNHKYLFGRYFYD